jgi:hypothetical protein
MSLLQQKTPVLTSDAKPPFSAEHASDSDTDDIPADLILRTEDNVDFHVYKGFFPSSPRYSTAFQPDEVRDGKPIVRVHDRSEALEWLLPTCYPFLANAQSTGLNGVEGALVAGDKYQIPASTPLLLTTLHSFVDQEPYSVLAIAIRRGLKDVMKAAALATLERPFFSNR